MHLPFAFGVALVLIALSALQMSADAKKNSPKRDFAIVGTMALMMTIYYCF
jgi:hypothetical protein